jgi:hypothetical protein
VSDKARQLLDVIGRQNVAIEKLIAERDKLRGELDAFVAWANGEDGALATLQRMYSNPAQSEANRLKAAGIAVHFEEAKPAAVVVQIRDFKERVRNARLRQLELDRAEWARQDAEKKLPLDLTAPTPETILGTEDPDSAA